MQSRNKIIIAVVLVLVLVVAVVLMLRSPSRGSEEGGDSARRGGWSDFFGLGGDSLFSGDGEPLSPKKVLFTSAAEYRERAKWPPYSLPISEKNDPVREDFEPSQQELNHPDHPDGPFLVHYLPKNSFTPAETLIVHAFLLDSDKKKIPFEALTATLTLGGAAGKVIANIDMRDDGQTGDEKGDLIYTAGFKLPADLARENKPQNYIVVIKAQTKAGEILGTNAFNVGYMNITHTGRFSDSIVSDEKGNHLGIEAEFQVEKEGFYHVQATVYSADGKGIGWAQNRVKLTPGKQMVVLKFYGNLFCSTDIDGPYTMRHFAYANVNAMPGPRSLNHKNLHTTQKYKATDFSCVPYDDAEFLAKAKLLEQESAEEKE